MSHELRTPLNSILILSQQLAENSAGNLSTKQVEFSRNINSSGSDLLNLINDILDLSKIESGTVTRRGRGDPVRGLARQHRPQLPPRGRSQEPAVPRRFRRGSAALRLTSDPKRLQQILKNLLSNAVKFTAHGHVRSARRLAPRRAGRADHPVLSKAQQVSPSPSRIQASASPRRNSD